MAHSGRVFGGDGVIRIERDAAFWIDVASHPALAGALYGLPPQALAAIIATPSVTPLASQHGGFIFNRLDAFGFMYELHTLFTPEGWGREVVTAGHEALERIFGSGAQVIVTAQMRDNDRSQPPRSFGFKAAGCWSETQFGEAMCWFLSHEAWQQSPAHKRRLS